MNSSVLQLKFSQTRSFYGRRVPWGFTPWHQVAGLPGSIVKSGYHRSIGNLVGEKSTYHSCIGLDSKIKRTCCTELFHFLKTCDDEPQTAICVRWVASSLQLIKEYHLVGECPYSEYV
jgi:hypothetical protein